MNRRAIKFVRAVFLAFIAFAHFSTAQVITTIAGGAGVFRGDGGPAGQATLGEMRGVAVDAAGNVYAADMDHSLVVKITPGGVVTVVAGNGIRGFSGDGGPATSASLNYPQGLALDSAGNLYIADFENYRVRKVTPSGIISTVAGNGQTGFSGDGGPALNASLPGPGGIVLDAASNLYVSDSNNNRIRKVDTNGIITTIAGTGPTGVGTGGFSGDGGPAQSARLNSPKGIVLDRTGNLYVADSLSHRIRKISVNGIITTVAGTGQESNSGDDGPAANAAVSRPVWLALDAAGGLYIGAGGNRIRERSALLGSSRPSPVMGRPVSPATEARRRALQ